ncbi:MAG TPA: hypothetical protein VI341_13025, partial [Actinomycetota bacterium]
MANGIASASSTIEPGPVAPLVAFGRQLRTRGLPVGTGRILTFVRAVAAMGLTDRESLYWAGRASLIARRDDQEAYDEAFDAWYRSLGATGGLQIELTLPAPGEQPKFDWGEQPDDLDVQVGETAAEWHGLDDDEEVEPGEETSIRIVASGA